MSVYTESRDDEASGNPRRSFASDSKKGDASSATSVEPTSTLPSRLRASAKRCSSRPWKSSGIGRPSTYVQIIDTIQRRGYVTVKEKRFIPTDLGKIIVDLLKEHFPDIVDVEFTANLEERLDRIEEGKIRMAYSARGVLRPLRGRFGKRQAGRSTR